METVQELNYPDAEEEEEEEEELSGKSENTSDRAPIPKHILKTSFDMCNCQSNMVTILIIHF